MKKSKLPIILILGPIVSVVASMVLAGIASSAAASLTPPVDPNSELFGDQPFGVKLLNVIAFLCGALGVISMIAILPCLVVGVAMLLKRPRQKV